MFSYLSSWTCILSNLWLLFVLSDESTGNSCFLFINRRREIEGSTVSVFFGTWPRGLFRILSVCGHPIRRKYPFLLRDQKPTAHTCSSSHSKWQRSGRKHIAQIFGNILVFRWAIGWPFFETKTPDLLFFSCLVF